MIEHDPDDGLYAVIFKRDYSYGTPAARMQRREIEDWCREELGIVTAASYMTWDNSLYWKIDVSKYETALAIELRWG